MITFNEIYSRARAAALAVNENAFVTSTYVPTVSKFPAVFIREISRFTPQGNVSIAYSQNVQEITISAEVYSNKGSQGKREADKILNAVERAFQRMYFIETAAAPIDNADRSIYRISARFRRVICDADTLPETEETT